MTLKIYDGYIYKGSIANLTSELVKVEIALNKMERPAHLKKMGLELSSFLDASFRSSVSLFKLDKWIIETEEDATFFEMKTVRVWFNSLTKNQCLVKFFNISDKHRALIEKTMSLTEYSYYPHHSKEKQTQWPERLKTWESLVKRNKWDNSGFMFTLYSPESLAIDQVFNHMPSLAKRQLNLAEKTIGNNWISHLPQHEMTVKLFEALRYLKTEEGKKAIEAEIKKIKKQSLIYKLEQIKVG